MAVLPTFSLAFTGDSTITGRLSANIVPDLIHDLPLQPEAVGPILVHDMGMGSQTSVWGVSNAPLISVRKPTHIISGGFELNGCVDFGGGPVVSRADNILNIQAMHAEWVANIPGVDITFQTMNSVSAAVAVIRPNLADYCADTIATATTLGARTLNHYAAWPKPLPANSSYYAAIGYSAWTGPFNPAVKNANITLTGSNLVATSAAANCAVRGLAGFGVGSLFYRVTFNNAAGAAIGVMQGGASVANGQYIGSEATSYGYTAAGQLLNNGQVRGNLQPFTSGDTIGVFVRFDVSKMWFSKNDVWLDGDPVAGVGGFDLTPGTYYPGVSLSNGGQATADFDTVFTGDGLHPLKSAVASYTYPALLAHIRMLMSTFW